MSQKDLHEIIGALENYMAKAKQVKDFDPSKYYDVQNELLTLGLDGHEADSMLLHTQIVSEFISQMHKVLMIFEKVATTRQVRAEKTTLLETKTKKLAEIRALSASLEAEIEELQK